MTMLRAVLWDNDGVLVNTERLFYEVNRETFARHGFTLSAADFFNWFLLDSWGGWHLFRTRGYSEDFISDVRRERNRRFGEVLAAQNNLLIDGMDVIVRTLAPIVKMALVTSSSREHLYIAHRNTDLLRHFTVVVTDDDCPSAKPSPQPYLLAMDKLGVSADQCIAIEDSPRGVLAANAAGIRCIAMASELTAHYSFGKAYAVVNGSSELLDLVRELLNR